MSPHTPSTTVRPRHRTQPVIPAMLLGAAWALVPAMTASAHDSIISTTPVEDGHAERAPTEVSMIYTDSLIEVGAAVVVVDEDGTNWADGPVALSGPHAVQPLRVGMPDGVYEVRWRVVSSDGHPIAGTYDFAVGQVDMSTTTAPGGEASTVPTAEQTTAPEAALPPDESTAALPDTGSGFTTTAGIAAVGALIGIVAFTAVTWLRGRRRTS